MSSPATHHRNKHIIVLLAEKTTPARDASALLPSFHSTLQPCEEVPLSSHAAAAAGGMPMETSATHFYYRHEIERRCQQFCYFIIQPCEILNSEWQWRIAH